ncbi:hypothetical protein DSC45_01565 [Streptomyces sp. YIM 130001]|uniref:hypothetical protein n=1 Tax=Streptomyces sp. YIM 130001 TaxID=2259644 RepID=UPI000EC25FD3|nr:hypothetical protein [Streptomyces sp. YIM 130001]RII21079.1 hypothetical protein DSC45_01565 [Streptomyces sp. YIM 130001]
MSRSKRASFGAVTATLCAGALLGGLTGCVADGASAADGGTADLDAAEISDRARKALTGADSVHLTLEEKGTDADADDRSPRAMDLTLDRDGNCAGSAEMGGDAGSFEIVKQGEKVWLKPDAPFWKAQTKGADGSAAAELFKNRWISGTTEDPVLEGLSDVCDLGELQDRAVTGDSDASGGAKDLAKGDVGTVDGEKAIPLTSTEHGRDKTLYVATEGKPYPLKATEQGDGTDRTITFTGYDEPVPTKTPAPADTVDIAKLRRHLQRT